MTAETERSASDVKKQLSSTIVNLIKRMGGTKYIAMPLTPLDHAALEYFSKKENANDWISARIPRYLIAFNTNIAGHQILKQSNWNI